MPGTTSRSFHHTIRHDKDFEMMLSWAHNKKTITSANCWAVLLTMDWDELVSFQRFMCTGAAKEKRDSLSAFLMAVRNVGGVIWWSESIDIPDRALFARLTSCSESNG